MVVVFLYRQQFLRVFPIGNQHVYISDRIGKSTAKIYRIIDEQAIKEQPQGNDEKRLRSKACTTHVKTGTWPKFLGSVPVTGTDGVEAKSTVDPSLGPKTASLFQSP